MDTNGISLYGMEVAYLAEAASRADAWGRQLHFMVKGSGLCYKVGEGMWSAPMGMVTWNESAHVPRHAAAHAVKATKAKCECRVNFTPTACPFHEFKAYEGRHSKPYSGM